MLRYREIPVPAGISLPMMTFSFSPSSESLLAWIAASVSTRVVSWNDAADSHDSVASDALVALGGAQPGPPGQLVEDDLLAAVVGGQHDAPALVGVLDADPARDLGDRRLALGDPRLEQLDDTRQTVRDVLTGDTAGVERP